jgi:hypothetical protein
MHFECNGEIVKYVMNRYSEMKVFRHFGPGSQGIPILGDQKIIISAIMGN